MNIVLTGKNLDDIRPLLPQFGLCESAETPDLVLAHGGDGTLLVAEHDYPGIPKLPLRDAATAPLCRRHSHAEILRQFRAGELPKTVLPKIAGSCNNRTIHGLNDVFIHNSERGSALRYRVRIDGLLYADEIVGDGVGVSTVHGSTAYYKSITHSLFRVGIGLAFSNSTEEIGHLVLDAASVVEIEIIRGPAIVLADNARDFFEAANGERIQLFQSNAAATVYGLEHFMCPECRFLRHPHQLPFRTWLNFPQEKPQ